VGAGYNIYIINSDGTGLQQPTSGSTEDHSPSMSDDCTKISFVRFDGSQTSTREIYIISSDATGLSQLTSNSYEDNSPDISGDGSKVVFACNEGKPSGQYDICIVNSDGTGWSNLVNSYDYSMYPSISYDGSKIAFVVNDLAKIFTINSDGSSLNEIYTGGGNPKVSGDATTIAFEGNGNNIYIINYDGTGLLQINNSVDPNANINNNGHRICFDKWDGSDREIFLWDQIADPQSTPAGSNVFVESTANGMAVTYTSVSAGCTTTFTYTPGGRALPPGKWAGASNLHYFISTTCSYTGPVEVRIDYNESDFFNEPAIRLNHWETGAWSDVTTVLDQGANRITGEVSSLSEFVIMEDEPPSPPEQRPGNQLINYQGRLTDSSGLPITGDVVMTFSLYEVLSGGTAIWSETQSVTVNSGIYHVLLGEVNPLSPDIFSRPYVYLGVQAGADPEMTPRSQVTSVPGALTIDGNRIEKGTATLNVSGASTGSINVTFATAFNAPPNVTVGGLSSDIGGESFVLTKIENITTTGFTATFQSLSGATATGSANFDWMAIGE
jgi:hypothetical protein